jgi:hypothetical protein
MEKQYKSYEYHFRDQRLYDDYCSLYSIGYEYWEDSSYYFDCKNVHVKQCIFRYTVSGEGAIEINRKTYPMKAGQAFLIEKPGPYKYYIPDDEIPILNGSLRRRMKLYGRIRTDFIT